jgi:hypothetical protein
MMTVGTTIHVRQDAAVRAIAEQLGFSRGQVAAAARQQITQKR